MNVTTMRPGLPPSLQNHEPKRASHVEDSIAKLEKSVSAMDETLGSLLSRLNDVMRPPSPAVTAREDPPMPTLVPVAERLRNQATRIDHLQAVLADIIDRIEV